MPVTVFSPIPATPPAQYNGQGASPRDSKIMAAAQNLEATFLSEMLKAAGFGKSRGAFGGGAGEDQFASFLRDAQAQEMVKVSDVSTYGTDMRI
ncbi:rod-binding protein [Phycobium rhodophyticola]